ncbi:unnamed protein product [Prunus armeniaca]|uniref:Uncharacterized protein n=1 Tax=Prunus armeniaca TaxID=36596 RepID=A0A6J5TZ62_PRUAR|nr:unnamed protein product [Prunus armeniaca]
MQLDQMRDLKEFIEKSEAQKQNLKKELQQTKAAKLGLKNAFEESECQKKDLQEGLHKIVGQMIREVLETSETQKEQIRKVYEQIKDGKLDVEKALEESERQKKELEEVLAKSEAQKEHLEKELEKIEDEKMQLKEALEESELMKRQQVIVFGQKEQLVKAELNKKVLQLQNEADQSKELNKRLEQKLGHTEMRKMLLENALKDRDIQLQEMRFALEQKQNEDVVADLSKEPKNRESSKKEITSINSEMEYLHYVNKKSTEELDVADVAAAADDDDDDDDDWLKI